MQILIHGVIQEENVPVKYEPIIRETMMRTTYGLLSTPAEVDL